MRVEVDSSGIWGNMAEPTVFAFSNAKAYTIWIAPGVKKACITEIRRTKKLDALDYVRLYAISVFLLLRDHLRQLSEIVLDLEYPRKMGLGRVILLELIRTIDPQLARIPIKIRRIGKTSRAHDKANAVFRGDQLPDRQIQAKEIMNLF